MSAASSAFADPVPAIDADLAVRLAQLDPSALRETFIAQHEFLIVEDFLPATLIARLVDSMQAARVALNRNFIPGHKKGGSVSRHAIDMRAPWIAALYRAPALKQWLEALCGHVLLPSPAGDPHAYALYFYTEPGDHIGWHYDTSYYRGARYTVLLGVVDRSSSRLQYRLHTRNPGHAPVDDSVALEPGALAVFNGDNLHHRVTPLGVGEERVALTFEYLTDARMAPHRRLVSNMKDAIAYFGFRQVFRRGRAT